LGIDDKNYTVCYDLVYLFKANEILEFHLVGQQNGVLKSAQRIEN